MANKLKSENCPGCGYPCCFNGEKYFGIYIAGHPCDNCGYVDEKAHQKLVRIEAQRKDRVKRNKDNPPRFKEVKDWEKYRENKS